MATTLQGKSIFFGNTVRASLSLQTDLIVPLVPGDIIKIEGFSDGTVVTNIDELIAALSLGGKIIVAAGTYIIPQTLSVFSGTTLIGNGSSRTIFQAADSLNATVLTLGSNVIIRGITVNGNAANNNILFMVRGTLATNICLEECTFTNSNSNAVRFSDCTNVQVIKCVFIDTGGISSGLNFSGATNSCCIVKCCCFVNVTNSSIVANIEDSIISNCIFKETGLIFLTGARTVFDNNILTDVGTFQSILLTGPNLTVSNNNVISSASANGIIVSSSATGTSIVGNTIQTNNIAIDCQAGALIEGNNTSLTSTNGVGISNSIAQNLVIANNKISGTTSNQSYSVNLASDVSLCCNQAIMTVGPITFPFPTGMEDLVRVDNTPGIVYLLPSPPETIKGHRIKIQDTSGVFPGAWDTIVPAGSGFGLLRILASGGFGVLEWSGSSWISVILFQATVI